MGGIDQKPGSNSLVHDTFGAPVAASEPGKKTLTEQLPHVASPTGPAIDAPQPAKLLVPASNMPPKSTIQVPDADHPSGRDVDGEQVIQTGKAVGPGQPTPLGGKSWRSLAAMTESVTVQDDSGDTLHVDTTYRLESRPAEISDVPDMWIHTERKALLTIGSGEHAGATIIGQARIHLAPGEALDPKMAVGKPSVGAHHWAQVYLAEAMQHVTVVGLDGRASLRADASGQDVLAYDDPLRMLIGLKDILKQQHVAGHGAAVAKTHARAQRLLADANRGRVILERELESVASYHDPRPGMIAPVRFLAGDIATWLVENKQAGRDQTEDARLLIQAHDELLRLIDAADNARAPKRDQLIDAIGAPGRFVERTGEGVAEVGAMAADAIVLGVDALGDATGIGTFAYHPISKYGKSIDASGASTTMALISMVNGIADQWSNAVERAKHGDYRSLTDVSVDTLMIIDGARTGGTIALEKAEALAGKLRGVAKSARALTSEISAGVTAEARSIAAAISDGADAFADRLRAGGMQMATSGGGGGPGRNLGGLSTEALADAARAAKKAFESSRLTHDVVKHAGQPDTVAAGRTEAVPHPPHPDTDVIAVRIADEIHRVFGNQLTPATARELGSISGVSGPQLEMLAARGAPVVEQLGLSLAQVHRWLEQERMGLVKVAASDVPDAARLFAKVSQHLDIEGMNTWVLLASRQLKSSAQLVDLEQSLNKAIQLRKFETDVAVEVNYYKGHRVSRDELNAARAKPDFDRKQHVNLDVESGSERWEMKRVQPTITTSEQLLEQIKNGAQKYTAGRLRNLKTGGPKKNIVDVELGNRMQLVGVDEAGIRSRVEAYIEKNSDVRQHVDVFIVHVELNGTFHEIRIEV